MDSEKQRIDIAFYCIMGSLIFFSGIMPFLAAAGLLGSNILIRLLLAAWALPISFILIAFMTAYKYGNKESVMQTLGLFPPGGRQIFRSVLHMTGLFFLLGIFTALYVFLLEKAGIELPEQQAVQLFKQGKNSTIFILLIASVILAPIGEELAFRHIIYRKLAFYLPDKAAVVFSALLFSVVHMNLRAFPALVFLGICLSYFCRENRSLWNSIAGHVVFNAVTILILLLMRYQILPGQ